VTQRRCLGRGERKGPRIIRLERSKPKKNHAMLNRAFKRSLQALDARLLMLGARPLSEETRALALAEGVGDKVLMPGAVLDPMPIMEWRLSSSFPPTLKVCRPWCLNPWPAACPSFTPIARAAGPKYWTTADMESSLRPTTQRVSPRRNWRARERWDREALKRRAREFDPHRVAEQYLRLMFG
jgi:hypothetical protein